MWSGIKRRVFINDHFIDNPQDMMKYSSICNVHGVTH